MDILDSVKESELTTSLCWFSVIVSINMDTKLITMIKSVEDKIQKFQSFNHTITNFEINR